MAEATRLQTDAAGRLLCIHVATIFPEGCELMVSSLRCRIGSTAMEVTIVSSREFNQDTSAAKKAASKGPVFITDRGRPAHVLLTIEQYEVMSGASGNIVDL